MKISTAILIGLFATFLSACNPTANNNRATTQEVGGAIKPTRTTAASTARFNADGDSPVWNAHIDTDSTANITITFSVPDTVHPDLRQITVSVTRKSAPNAVLFTGHDDGIDLTLRISDTPCNNAGAPRKFSARMHYGNSVYDGCADAVK